MSRQDPLERLREELSVPTDGYLDPTLFARLSLTEFEGLVHVDFSGAPFDEPFANLCKALTDPHVSEKLASLILRCPDEGANGTCNWDLTALADSDSEYPALKLLSVQQNVPGNHNRVIVAADYDEAGVLGRLLHKAPVLDALVSPSAPDRSFFSAREHPLRYLNVDAGYDTQSFIANLSVSQSFPGLMSLEFGEYNETYIDTFPAGCTPYEDYAQLFSSTAFSTVRAFTWRNPVCSPEQIAQLRAARNGHELQFQIVRFSSEYVSD